MAPRSRSLMLSLCALLAGCGGGESEEASSGAPGDCAPGQWLRDDGVCVPAGLPPDMPCPPGEWLRQEDGLCIPAGVPPDGCGEGFVHDGDRGCEAILPAEPCPDGLMAVPGETRCREVAPCAPGRWGNIPVEPDTEYVDASYAGGASDGSQTAPWTSVQAAVDAALPGAIVAVAAGSYAEDVTVQDKPVRLWGKCPALVELIGSDAGFAALDIGAGASQSEVRRLAITGQARGVFLSGSEDVVVEETWIHESARRGIGVENAFGPTSLAVRGSLLEQNHELGVFVSGSDATVEATVVRDTLPNAQGGSGRGIGVQDDPATGARASAVVARSLLEQNHGNGVLVGGSDATVEATVVRDTLSNPQGLLGRAVHVQRATQMGAAASALLRASLFERSFEAGILVNGSATVALEACLVRDTAASEHGFLGDGLVVWSYTGLASATVTATRIAQSDRAAVSGFGAAVALESSLLVCQSFDIGAESWQGENSIFDNRGGVLCGCPEATEPCKAQSYALEPPPPPGE